MRHYRCVGKSSLFTWCKKRIDVNNIGIKYVRKVSDEETGVTCIECKQVRIQMDAHVDKRRKVKK